MNLCLDRIKTRTTFWVSNCLNSIVGANLKQLDAEFFRRVLFLLLWVTVIPVYGQSLTWLGMLGGSQSQAYDVSSDGSVVVGEFVNSNGETRAFRWENGVMQDLGTLTGTHYSGARAVSRDGAVVVGWSYANNEQSHAFRWENGVMQDIGTLGGENSEALDVTANGSTVVGRSKNASGEWRAFSWSGGMIDLGAVNGWEDESEARGITADGSVVVGWAKASNGRKMGFANIQFLDTPEGYVSAAEKVSDAGSIIVGAAYIFVGYYEYHAIRWYNGVWEDLGTLGGNAWAWDVSADGSRIVGSAYDANGQQSAFLWENGVMSDLNVIYDSLLSWNSRLWTANAISPDGRFIVGAGKRTGATNMEAFILDTQGITGIERSQSIPKVIQLYQNYPNPFNPKTNIQYLLSSNQNVVLSVYDLNGREIKNLVNESQPAGTYTVQWDGTNHSGQQVSSGVYLYRLRAGDNIAVRKMLLVR